jgi:hypothetical protein
LHQPTAAYVYETLACSAALAPTDRPLDGRLRAALVRAWARLTPEEKLRVQARLEAVALPPLPWQRPLLRLLKGQKKEAHPGRRW